MGTALLPLLVVLVGCQSRDLVPHLRREGTSTRLANQSSSLDYNSTQRERKVLFSGALSCQEVSLAPFSWCEGHLNSGDENEGNTKGRRGEGESPTASSELLDLLLPDG